MRFRIGGGIFTLRLWPTFLTLVIFAILAGLGTWQVERLHWKENLIATIEMRMKEAPVDAARFADSAHVDYRNAYASGIFQNGKEIYTTAISPKGEGGYHVLTPLRLKKNRYLLVNRGWVPYGKKLPDTRKPGQLSNTVTIKGILRVAPQGWMQPSDKQKIVRLVSLPEFLPFVLEADAAPNPGGYPVGGQTRLNLPNNHLGYAITWYALALALLIIYGFSAFQKSSAD
ncbi:MAG: SURF1 family protein [Alphaproteobacteria bacterium]|nr:SURF1 family protein [Alphaproteobacteria bacterium]